MKNKWISVKDRLPEHLEDVIILIGKNTIDKSYYCHEEKEWNNTNFMSDPDYWINMPSK